MSIRTLEGAMRKAVHWLGIDAVADIVDKSDSAITRGYNPNDTLGMPWLTANHMIELDARLIQLERPAYFALAMAYAVEERAEDMVPILSCPSVTLADAATALAGAMRELAIARARDSEGGEVITENEARAIITACERAAARVRHAVRSVMKATE